MSVIIRSMRTLNKAVSYLFVAPSASCVAPTQSACRNNIIKKLKSTLGQSFVLIQDGIEITELPWVVKRLNSSELCINGKNGKNIPDRTLPSSSNIHFTDEMESEFTRLLQECNSVREVIQLLEVPGEAVNSQTAASALCRIGMLKSQSTEDFDSFLRKAILNELCDTISRDLKSLSNQTVTTLTGCCLRPNGYEDEFVEKITDELEYRIAASVFSIGELCRLITILSETVGNRFGEMVDLCWVHLGSRFVEINENNIADTFKVLQYLTPKFRYLIRIVDKQIQTCWSKLRPADVAVISKWLSFLNYHNGRTLSVFGRWLYSNVHSLNEDQMKHVLGMYMHFNTFDGNVNTALEKFIKAFSIRTVRGINNSKDRILLHMAATFCRQKRWLSPTILDSLARDFSLSPNLYTVMEGASVLKTFGRLGYVPPNSSKFFSAAESWIESNLDELSFPDLLELLASLVYIERFPVNFIHKVLTTNALIFSKETSNPLIRNKASRHLMELQASRFLEFPWKPYVPFIFKDVVPPYLTWLDGPTYRFQKEISVILKECLGNDCFTELISPKNTPHLINFEIALDVHKNPLKQANPEQVGSKLAIILAMPEHLTTTGTLLGEYSMRNRHLERLGYEILMVNYEKFPWKGRSHAEKTSDLKSILSGHVNLKS